MDPVRPDVAPILRRATAADYAAAVEVYIRVRAASIPAIPPPVHDDDDTRSWFPTMAVEHEVWVAESDGSVVAILTLSDTFVSQLYVMPEHQGKGIGTALLGIAKRQRPKGLQLWAFESNLGARRFYEQHGFAAVQRTDGDNEEGAPDVRYQWVSEVAV
jgi:GNAT superfamily N-acetyltransferase